MSINIEIVKVQVPMATSDPRALALVYAKGRQRMSQQKLDARTEKAMAGGYKAFFKAQYSNGVWLIGERVMDQNW